MSKTLINCDLGECLSPNPDPIVMPLIDMANIACGAHAGDENSIRETLLLAHQHQVEIGVHPAYQDRANFGRVSQALSVSELTQLLSTQLLDFQRTCEQLGFKLSYVKPHGALYHDMMNRPEVLDALCSVISQMDTDLNLVVQAGFENYVASYEKRYGLRLLHEVFADRGYRGLTMLPRTEPGAVLNDPQKIVDQFWHFANDQSLKIDTICFHSDNKASVEALKQLNHAQN